MGQEHDDARGWVREGDWERLFERLGYEVRTTAIPAAALGAWGWRGPAVTGVTNVVAEPGFRVNLVRDQDESVCRSLALAVARQNPTVCVLWVFVNAATATVAVVDDRPDGQPFLRKMAIDCTDPDPVTLSQLLALARGCNVGLADEEHGASMRKHLVEVLDQEGLTREFFRGFRDLLELLQTRMIGGPVDRRLRHEVSLVVLLRLVFLYFLQEEKLLNGDPRFLARHLRAATSAGVSYWDNVLRPLFFGVLNTEVARRDAQAARLGDVPFLNGGLFEPVEAERGDAGPCWDNAVWHQIIDGFFERYRFTTTEPESEDEVRAVDPEMLGKVFEGLMYGDDRRRSGAFYTPRDVVRRMVEDAVLLRLTAVTGLAPGALAGTENLRGAARDAVIEALSDFTVLDPAVGTGAFLLESLHVLRRWYARVGCPGGWAATRDIIHRHLYGVDVEHTAVRLCELRLWLAMLATGVASTEPLPPLPNLSHRIATGDSLVEPADLGRLSDEMGRGFVGTEVDARRRQLERQLDALQTRFLSAHGDEKTQVRTAQRAVERALQACILDGRRDRLLRLIEPLESVEASVDLFGDDIATRAQRHGARELRDRLAAVERAIGELEGDRASVVFSYESRFGDAARRGFDVVLTNPPWVRATRLDIEAKRVLSARYRAADNTLWPGASTLGIRTPFGTQQDLAALFLERSLELLRPGGVLCALVPSKLLRSLHGASLRRVLGEVRVEQVEDLSDADRELFEATTYPAVLTARKVTPPRDHAIDTIVWRGSRRVAFRSGQRNIGAMTGDVAEPWLLVAPHLRAVFAKMYDGAIPLGAIEGLAPARGVFTGANDVFIRRAGELEALLGGGAREWIRPVISGASLGDGGALEILWAYDDAGALRPDVPPELREWFAPHRDRLAARADADPRLPDWQVFRVQPHTMGPKVAWRDIAPHLEAVSVDPDAVPLNTVYYVPCPDEQVALNFARWMNSLPIRALARELAERARGGWRRHFAWVVRMLPVPAALAHSGFAQDVPLVHAFGLDARDLRLLENAILEQGVCKREAA